MTAMYSRILQSPTRSFFLFGARGTGKSTWLRASFPGAVRIDLLDEAPYQRYLADPGLFRLDLNAAPDGSRVVVDEVQRLPSLLNEVHRQIEERQLRFALTGSSARKIRRAGVNLLAGRAQHRSMYAFCPEELGADYDLERALTYGTLPLIWASDSPGEDLDASDGIYLKEEIQGEALVRNLPGFARFLPIAGLLHGQVLSISNLARDAGVARTTANDYLDVLEDTLLVRRLPAFEPKLRVRERHHPKLYWLDPGPVRTLARRRGAPSQEERGPLFEGIIHQLLCVYRDTRDAFDELTYWSPADAKATEVDFVATRGDEHVAVEVKATSRLRDDHFKGLRAIAPLQGLRRRVLVLPETEPMRTDDAIDVWSLQRFSYVLAAGGLFEPSQR